MAIRRRRLFIYSELSAHIPFNSVRVFLLRWCGFEIGRNTVIHRDAVFSGDGGRVVIGNNVLIGPSTRFICSDGGLIRIHDGVRIQASCLLSAKNGSLVELHSNVNVAHFVSLQASSHHINTSSTARSIAGAGKYGNIIIGRGSWICAGAIILTDVTIGEFSVVAAGAVVLKSCPARSLLAGNPAIIKKTYPVTD